MTTLILRLAGAPSFDGLGWFGRAFRLIFGSFADAQELARNAQRRYPFIME